MTSTLMWCFCLKVCVYVYNWWRSTADMLWQSLPTSKISATQWTDELSHLKVDFTEMLIEVGVSREFFMANWTCHSSFLQERKWTLLRCELNFKLLLWFAIKCVEGNVISLWFQTFNFNLILCINHPMKCWKFFYFHALLKDYGLV